MASNARSKTNGQNKKLLNNFIESLDINGGTQYVQQNAYSRKAMQSQGPAPKSSVSQIRTLHNNTAVGAANHPNKRTKQLVSSSLNIASSSQPTNPSSYNVMRYSHQGFGTNVTNLNSSLMLPGTNQNAIDLNNTQNIHGGSVGHIGQNSSLSHAQTKQWMNASFDASKSANQLNYVNSAYITVNQTATSP